MKIVEEDTNVYGQQTYLLNKENPSGTLIVAVVKDDHCRMSFHYLMTGKPLTARDAANAHRLVTERFRANECKTPARDVYECELCGRTFHTRWDLDQHEHDAVLAWDETWGLVEE